MDEQYPDLLRQSFSDYAVESFVVREVTCVVSSAIILVKSTTNFLSACVTIAIFSNAIVSSCCIAVNNAALDYADLTLASCPSVFEDLEGLRVFLNALAK